MTEEKIINRIKKMLALANDLAATEGERDNALRMAYNLMAKHNLDIAEIEAHGKKAEEQRIDFQNDSWSWLWAKQVNHIVGCLFFCKYYYGRSINGTQCEHHFIGRESNAMTAAVMADYIVNSILKEGRKIGKQNTSPITRSFCVGAMQALSARVTQIIAEKEKELQGSATPGTALVLASFYKNEQGANEQWLVEHVGALKAGRAHSHKVNGDAWAAGAEYGRNINLNMQVGESKPTAKQIR
jgi:hypothetical protein